MKAINIALKTLKEALRDPQLLIMFLTFPGMMVLIYFFAYGSGTKSLANSLILLVENQDRGALGGELIKAFRAEEFDGAALLTVIETHDPRMARTTLNEWKAGALLTIPSDFTEVIQTADPNQPPRLHILRDPFSDNAIFLSAMFEEPLRTFIENRTGWKQPQQLVTYDFIQGTGNLNDFQFGIPGLIVFGVTFGIIYSAILLVRELVNGGIQRLRMANISGWSFLGGITLSQLVVCTAQVILTLLIAYFCGLQSAGSIFLLGIFALALSLAATGCGMITACFSKNDGEVANLSMLFIMPLIFFSGALYPLPAMPLLTIAGKTLYFDDLMPTTYATDAIRRIMIYGDNLQTVWPGLFWVVVQSIILFILGVWLFQRLRLSRSV